MRLGITLAVAALLRFLGLGRQSLWLDEMGSWWFASRDLSHVLRSEPTNPPLYYLLLHAWMGWFGTSESAIRSLSIVPSLLSVWLIFRFSRQLFNRGIAYLAAIYLAISTFQIYYAQEARCFSLLVSILLLATLCLWNALEADSPRRRHLFYAAYAFLGALALYAHFISIFFLAAHGLYVLFRRPRQTLLAGGSIAVSLLLFSPWLVTMLRAAAGGGQVRRYLLLKLPQTFFSFLYGYSLIPLDDDAVRHIPQTLKANGWILAASLLSLAILLPFVRLAWKRWGDKLLFVLTIAVVPVVLAFLVSFKVMLFSERYLIPSSPFLYIVVAATIWEVWRLAATKEGPRWPVHAGWAASGIWAVLLALSLHNYYSNPRFGKEQWREADTYIDSLAQPGENTMILFDPDYLSPCYQYYTTRNLRGWRITPQVEAKLETSGTLLEEQTQGYQHIVLVRSHDNEDTVVNAMRKVFSQQGYRKFDRANPIEVYSFRVPTK
ncbi:MAG: glycosyltransferase family 39 protein [Candidatus Acidiferrales bacterium]